VIPDGLITYTVADLERMSRELFRRRPDVAFESPINVERLLQGVRKDNVDLEYIDGMRLRHCVEGCIWKVFMSPKIVVCIDSVFLSGSWAEYNAVLAEEFAHIYLHPALFNFVMTIEDTIELQQDPQWARFEGDAKRFSEMVRMPAPLVLAKTHQAYSRAADDLGFGSSERIEQQVWQELFPQFRVLPDEMRERLSHGPINLTDAIRRSALAASTTLTLTEAETALVAQWRIRDMRLDDDFLWIKKPDL